MPTEVGSGDRLAFAITGARVIALATLGLRSMYSKCEIKKVDDVKGLEYDSVVVVDPAAILAGFETADTCGLRIASDASWVSGAYRNTTAEMVTIALMKR